MSLPEASESEHREARSPEAQCAAPQRGASLEDPGLAWPGIQAGFTAGSRASPDPGSKDRHVRRPKRVPRR